PRSGRLEVLSRLEKRYILLMVKKNRHIARKALINVFYFPSKKYDYRFINLKNYI
ncbi:uncharacterized protein P884DRAFT_201091, partial [Thermothelomyces heterothallicus CBS 202.75]|uniref:uncharacterized protein n=1 Tax=Thermothelomyces heterothallicus CBS 202.75 TaxID=1149848 RepID=UPI0037434D67